MASAELRKPRRISKLSATVAYKVDRSIDTALSDPILPAYGSPRTFGGRNLVVTSIEAEEISPSHCYVYVTYGPPGRMLGGDIEPSEPSFTDKSLDFTSEPLEIPYYEPLPAVTESGTPYTQWVRRPRIIPRGVMLLEVIVNLTNPGITEIQAINGQVGKLHSIGGQAVWLFEGAQWQQVSHLQWTCSYSWRASEPHTPAEVVGLLGPTEALPPHAVYEDIRGVISGTGGNAVEGPPTFVINGVRDNGNIAALPGNPLGALS